MMADGTSSRHVGLVVEKQQENWTEFGWKLPSFCHALVGRLSLRKSALSSTTVRMSRN